MQLLAGSHTVKQSVESLLRLKWETAMVLRKTWVLNSKLYSEQLLDEVILKSRIIKVKVGVISGKLRVITLTETLIILDIT